MNAYVWFIYNLIHQERGHSVVPGDVEINSDAPNVKAMMHVEALFL